MAAASTRAQSTGVQLLTASDAAPADSFGSSLAVSGDTIAVGARYANCAAGDNCGSAYIYRRSGTSWIQEQKLTVPVPTPYSGFGRAVGVSGDTAIVGENIGCADGNLCGSAQVFRFNGTEWVHTQALVASDAAALDSFGARISMSGNTALIGAQGVDCAGPFSDCGAAYIFRFDGTSWVEEQKLIASDIADHDGFGGPISLFGNTAVVGSSKADCAAGVDCGAAYVFRFNGVAWVEEKKLTASDAAARVRFGASVSVFEDTIMVGASAHGCGGIASAGLACGSVYVFRFDGTNWVEEQKLFASDPEAIALFGAGVAVDGQTAVVGAPQKNCTAGILCGAAYIFRFDGNAWVEERKLTAIDRKTDDNFGISVALDGDTAVAGGLLSNCRPGLNCGSAYVFSQSLSGVPAPIPAASTWGLVCLTLLVLTTGTIAIRWLADSSESIAKRQSI